MTWLTLRADLRRRWRPLLALALLLGLLGGVVLTAAAGARRTDTAYPRMLAWANSSQLDILPQGVRLSAYDRALAALPQVESTGAGSLYQAALPADRGTPVLVICSPDGTYGTRVDRVRVQSGHLMDQAVAGQAMVNQAMAAAQHLRPGDAVRVLGVPNNPVTGTADYSKAVTFTFRVTAIVTLNPEMSLQAGGYDAPIVLVSAPFAATPLAPAMSYGDVVAVRLRPGAPVNVLVAADQRPAEIRNYASVRDVPLVLGAVLAALAVATLAHVLLTSVRRRRRDLAVLKTLGLTRGQVLRLVGWQATALAAVALLAGLPLGVIAGRQAWGIFASAAGVAPEPDVPLPLILLAIPVTLLLANLIAAWPGWTAARVRPAVALRTE